MRTVKLMLTVVAFLATSQLPAAEGDKPIFDLDHFLTEKKALIEEILMN